MKSKKYHHPFYTPFYAGDDHSESWISYLHRNLHHLSGEDHPFPGTEWHNDEIDADLHDEVIDALYHSDKLDASLIKVFVLNQNVSLIGCAYSLEEKKEAENVVRNIKNVWGLTNNLVVNPRQ